MAKNKEKGGNINMRSCSKALNVIRVPERTERIHQNNIKLEKS
jgi:hypothetical protein